MSHHSPMTLLRRRLAIVLAALLAIAMVPLASPAGAAPAPAPDISDACEHAESAGFTDIAGSGFEDYINCLAAFGVTTGTTATTYSPAVQVRRSQMALFYYRIGDLFGVEWDTTDAGFTDLGGLGDDFVDAINALANAGIVQGTSEDEFSPQDRIRRSQMALFIDRFQALDEVGGFRYSDGLSGDDLFPDLGQLGDEARDAVNGIGSKGITQGDANGNYVPSGFVSRQQMAAFIVRHLVENGLEVGAGPVTGVVVDTDYTLGEVNSYTIAVDGRVIEVEPGEDASFALGGVPATEAVFSGSATLGALVTYNEDADSHNVVPQNALTAGFIVGDLLDLGANDPDNEDFTGAVTNLLEPISGTEMFFNQAPAGDPVDIVSSLELDRADATYRIGNRTVGINEFMANISHGDILTVDNYTSTTANPIYRLQNGSLTGTVDIADLEDTGSLAADFTAGIRYIGTDGNPAAWDAGNDLAGDDEFVFVDDQAEQRYSAGGAPVNLDGLEDWVLDVLDDDADAVVRVTYSRSAANGIENFEFVLVDPDDDDDVEPGSVTGTYIGGSATAAQLEMLVNGTIVTVSWTSPPAGILVDGVIHAAVQVPGAIQAGATVTVSVGNDTQITNTTAAATEAGDLVIITNP